METNLITSRDTRKTRLRSSTFPSFAKAQGLVLSIYLFVIEIIPTTESIALLNSTDLKQTIYSERFSSQILIKFCSSSLSSCCSGITPLRLFFVIEKTLFTRFPKLFASSELILLIKASSEKSPSLPKGTSLNKKYLNWSSPYLLIISSGLTTFPKDLDIFSFSTVHQP